MSVKPVKAISIIGMMSELDKVVDFCGESEVFQPDDAMSFYSDTKNFLPLSTKNPYSAPMQQLKNSADLAGFKLEYTESEHKSISTDETIEYIAYFVSETESMVNKKLKLEQDIDSCKRTLEQVEHFAGCDIDFSQINDCRFITPNFGRLPKESYDKLSQFSDNQFALFFPFTNDDTHYWGAYFTIPEQKEDIDRIFSSLYFERLEIPPISGTPDDYMKKLEKELEGYENELEGIEKKIDSFWKKEKDKCLMHYSKLEELYTCGLDTGRQRKIFHKRA